ncbi:MAG: DUF4124 domain-containing protein [Deltaproteobacteria bacterium]|nr:DUF4124 domain-containing protein [Deltaproteobacteria bacterium]
MNLKSPRMIVGISTCLLLFITITHLTLIFQAQAGELYRWKDKDGNVYLSDTPPDASVHQGEVKSTYAPEEPTAATERKPTSTQPSAVRQKDVTIYTNTT